MANQDWNKNCDDTASDNTDTRWEPIPDEVWFSSPAGDFGMEADWKVEADIQEAEATRRMQSDSQADSLVNQATVAAAVQPDTFDTPEEPNDLGAQDGPDGMSSDVAAEVNVSARAESPVAGAQQNAAGAHFAEAPSDDGATTASFVDSSASGSPSPGGSSLTGENTDEATRLLADVPTQRMSDDEPTVLATPLTDAAAESADRTTVVGGGNPYRVTQRRQVPQAPAPERTQVWAAPYAGQASYENATPSDTATARRPSILKRRQNTQQTQAGNQAPYYAAGGRNDGSPVPAAQGGRRREHKRPRHGCLSLFLWLVMLIVAGLMSLRTLSAEQANGSMVPELVAFIPLLFVPIIVCFLLALLWRRRLLAVCCAAAFAVMFWWHAGFFIPSARVSSDAVAAAANAPSTGDNVARIMTVNTNNGMASAQEIVDICREQNVEILCLQELGGSMLEDLEAAGIDEVLPYSIVSDQATQISNGGRNGIWSAAPMDNISTNLLPIETSSMPAADITVGDQTIRVVSVHPNSPVRGAQDLWDDGLATIGQLQDYDHSYVIMGDFNSTWNHARFRDLLGASFVDAGQQSGEGFHMTFPSSGPIPPLVELDHILYTKDSGVVVSELSCVEVSGTDHMALLGTLETT